MDSVYDTEESQSIQMHLRDTQKCSVDFAAFIQQQFGKISAILTGDTGGKSFYQVCRPPGGKVKLVDLDFDETRRSRTYQCRLRRKCYVYKPA
jgi:hypothetical protein